MVNLSPSDRSRLVKSISFGAKQPFDSLPNDGEGSAYLSSQLRFRYNNSFQFSNKAGIRNKHDQNSGVPVDIAVSF